jgi:hypothetical protein
LHVTYHGFVGVGDAFVYYVNHRSDKQQVPAKEAHPILTKPEPQVSAHVEAHDEACTNSIVKYASEDFDYTS